MQENNSNVTPPPRSDIDSRKRRRGSGMAPTNQPVPAPLPGRVARLLAIGRRMLDGLLLWMGEAVIGVVPLLAHEVVARFGKVELAGRTPEECILAVVISGLALLSLVRFGPRHRREALTRLTYQMGLISLLALVAGAVMYGLAEMGLGGDSRLAHWALAAAFASSLVIALEEAMLGA